MTALTGKVFDAVTGKPIYNAHVVFTDGNGNPYSPLVGTVTGFDGEYALETLGGQYIKVSHVSYKPQIKKIDLKNFASGGNYSQIINFSLEPANVQLPEVVITAKATTWLAKNKKWLVPSLGIGLLLGFAFVKKQ